MFALKPCVAGSVLSASAVLLQVSSSAFTSVRVRACACVRACVRACVGVGVGGRGHNGGMLCLAHNVLAGNGRGTQQLGAA